MFVSVMISKLTYIWSTTNT